MQAVRNAEWAPESLFVAPDIAAALKAGKDYVGDRFEGKTETLLNYVALFGQQAILVAPNESHSRLLRYKFKQRYPHLLQPRFLTMRQFEQRDGLYGQVFTDECDLSPQALSRICPPYLTYGGGVRSFL